MSHSVGEGFPKGSKQERPCLPPAPPGTGAAIPTYPSCLIESGWARQELTQPQLCFFSALSVSITSFPPLPLLPSFSLLFCRRLYVSSYTNVTLFNLLGISIPPSFDDAVIDKVISGQDVIIQTNLRDSLLIQSDIQLTAATAAANITLIQQRAGSEGLIILKRAEAELAQELLQARALQLKDLSDGLGFTSPDELIKYVYLDVLRAQGTGTGSTIVQQNVDSAVIKM